MVITPDWTQVFIDFIIHKKLSEEKLLAKQVSNRSKNYCLVSSKLYRQGTSFEVLMKCVTPVNREEILQEIHIECCNNHAASRTLVGKAFRLGYYWPTIVVDAEGLFRRCKGCQFFATSSCASPQPHMHPSIMVFLLLGARHGGTT